MELNKIYCMDNLELLKQLDDNSIDLIYCDILYNTGKKFKDYDDKLGTPRQAIEWYRPRLIEMKRVLKDVGSIYLQCDYNLSHYLKVEMDSIFGLINFRNEIIWCYNSPSNSKKDFPKKHDTLLKYSKGNYYTFNFDSIRIPYDEKTIKRRSYNETNKNGIKFKGKDIEEYEKGKIPCNWWSDIPSGGQISRNELAGYNTQKPKKLLERIIKASSNEGDVVADFFVGSGTSMVVAKELGRNYIGCDINQKAINITNKRLDDKLGVPI